MYFKGNVIENLTFDNSYVDFASISKYINLLNFKKLQGKNCKELYSTIINENFSNFFKRGNTKINDNKRTYT